MNEHTSGVGSQYFLLVCTDMKCDRLFITALELPVTIGVLPHERNKKQTVLLDIVFSIDGHKAATTDCIENTIDYAKACDSLFAVSQTQHFSLIETFAYRCIERLFKRFTLASAITLTVRKQSALQHAECAGISIHRTKQDMLF